VPLQNRVSPFGVLIATSARGTLMGNRGCLHDDQQRIRRAFVGRRWIICLLRFKGRRRAVMMPRRYTELFFLDEATALAAGHRPCVECQRGRYLLFREHWRAANPELVTGLPQSVDAIDAVLHGERLDARRARRTHTERAGRLPTGAMIADPPGQAWLVHGRWRQSWTPEGYGAGVALDPAAEVTVLTPPSIVRALAHGYPVEIHPSARAVT
jgi:hypothetical protein